MSTAEQIKDSNLAERPAIPAQVSRTLLHVAWMSILLGLVIQALLMILAVGFTNASSVRPFIADLVQKVSWAAIVCVGIALGSIVSQLRVPAMGLAGLLAAPLAFAIARVLHKTAAQALGVMFGTPSGLMLFLVVALKAAEYGCLGAAIGWIQARQRGRALAHAGIGLAAGIIFGGSIVAVMARLAAKPIPPADLVSRGLNELLFPVGCSLVLYAADALNKRRAGLLG